MRFTPDEAAANRKLNVGCGRDIRQGWVNLDKFQLPGVDIVHDLTSLPLPFPSDHFAHISAKDVLEHIEYIDVLRDLHRVLVPGGRLDIQVPHFSSADNFIDPTHAKLFSIRTFDFFTLQLNDRDYYFDFAFREITVRRLTFRTGLLFYNHAVSWLINAHYKIQQYYELTLLHSLFPAQNIQLTLVK